MSNCPKCKTSVEKIAGCNHMTCQYCNFQWCWICGGTYTPNHYNKLNPLGCGGMQFAEKPSMCGRIMVNVGKLLLFLVLVPLVLMLAVPLFVALWAAVITK